MINLLKWLLFPVFYIGGGGGGDGGAADREAAEESRKQALRDRIDRLYGAKTTRDVIGVQEDPSARGLGRMLSKVLPRKLGEETDPEAIAAIAGQEGENTKLADATRGYYADQLGKDYAKAERTTRFKLARTGLLGGSEDVNQQGEVKSDRDLGATRVDEAVARAVSGLKTQREQERLNSIQLVNSGAGESAVSAAQTGLRNSFENANTAQKADLFGDLFASGADAVTTSNMADREAALLGRYRDRLSSFFPTKSTGGGRVTPSG